MSNEEFEKIENKAETSSVASDASAVKVKESVWKNPKKRASILAAIVVVSIIVFFVLILWAYFFKINYPTTTFTYKNISELKKDYVLDDTNERIDSSCIDYESYLHSVTDVLSVFKHSYTLSEEGVLETNDAAANTAIIKSILEEATGSIVIYVDGNYKINPIELRSNTTIVIQENCSLIGPTYEESVDNNISFTLNDTTIGLLYAFDKNNIAIYGPGSIVCNGTSYTNEAEDSSVFAPLTEFNVKDRVLEARKRIRNAITSNRPHAVYFSECSNIKFNSFKIEDSANWTCKLIDCNKINIEDLVIDNNLHVANADGIDLVSCQDVNIFHCFIATADDGVCVKANGRLKTEDIKVNYCTIISMANCFKIGTETYQDVEKVEVLNCYFMLPKGVCGGYAGVSIESADGSNIYDVTVDNIYMSGISSPFLIWLGSRGLASGKSETVGSIKKIKITNITSNNCELPSAITGCQYGSDIYRVKDVLIANFVANYRNTAEKLSVGDPKDEDGMSGYPEITRVIHLYFLSHEKSKYDDLPVYGLFARHVDGIEVNNMKITPRSSSKLIRDNITQAANRIDCWNVAVK